MYDQTNGGPLDGATATKVSTQKMETHGGCDVLESHLQKTCENNLTETFY